MNDATFASVGMTEPPVAWLDPLVAGVLFLIALTVISGWPASTVDAVDRVPFVVPPVAAICAIGVAVERRTRGISTVVAAAVASGACVAPVLWPTLTARAVDRWSPLLLGSVVAGIAVATALVVFLARRIRSDPRGGSTLVALTLLGMTIAAPGLMAANHSISLAQRAGPLGVIAIALLVVGLVLSRRAASSGVVAFVVAVLGAELVMAWHWSDLPGWEALAIAAAIPIAWATFELPFVPRRLHWLRVALALLLAATPTIAAGVVAGIDAQRASTSTGDEGYGSE